jgi:hypothetical protein
MIHPAFNPTFQETVLTSLERLTSELQHLREDVTELKQHGETRDKLLQEIQANVQSRDHARQNDIVAIKIEHAELSKVVVGVQASVQTFKEKADARMLLLERTAGHRITMLEEKSSILKGGYAATLLIGSVMAFLFDLLYHALDLGKFFLKK